MRRIALIAALSLLAVAAASSLVAGVPIYDTRLADRVFPISVDGISGGVSVSLPAGGHGTYLILVNEGERAPVKVYINSAPEGDDYILVEVGKPLAIPVSITSLGLIDEAGHALHVRGAIFYYVGTP